jgi:FecR protein
MDKHADTGERITGLEEGDDIARLLRNAGKRAVPPPDLVERVRTQVHAVWREELARRRRRRLFAVAASVLTLTGAGWWMLQQRGASAPLVVASIERGSADLTLHGGSTPDGGSLQPAVGATVSVGDRLETGPDAGAVLRLASGADANKSLRLAPGTSIAWVAPGQVRLLGGQLYMDAGNGTPGAGPVLAIEAAGVRVQHVGTRFLVALSDTHVDVKVRDGTVRIEGAGEVALLQGGEQGRMALGTSGVTPVQRLPVGSSGEEWSWVDELAPGLDIDEQSLWSVLQRAAREGGLEVRFESAQVEQQARETVLHGPALEMSPRQALDAVLVTTAYVAEPDGSGLLVRRR